MLIYFLFLLPPLVLAWRRPPLKRYITFSAVAYFITILLFMGLRDKTGPDWGGYLNIYEVVNFNSDATKTESLFAYLNMLSEMFGLYIYGVNFVCTCIFLLGVFSYANCTARPWLAIAAVTPYLCFVIGMSGIRQAAAIGISYIALANWKRLSAIAKLAFIAVAMGFHTSAAFLIVLVLFEDHKRLWLKSLVASLLIGYFVGFGFGSDSIEQYNSRYLEKNVVSTGAVQHVLLSAFPAGLYLFFRKRIAMAGWDNSIVTIGAICSIIALPLTAVSSTGVDRLALYFSYVQMWVYPSLVATFKGSETVLLACVTAIIISVFLIYFTIGATISGYIPYGNLLFQ